MQESLFKINGNTPWPEDMSFFCGKKVFLTGHTGFKGTWLSYILLQAGAELTGYALPVTDENVFFSKSNIQAHITSVSGDIRNRAELQAAMTACAPDIVIHMAAQPLVRDSYRAPAYTYETNVMGTVNLLECVRENGNVHFVLNVTTDKVYRNMEWEWGYRENDPLDGHDPYSNSKSCSELVTHTYKRSFFQKTLPAMATARAGNVIGGGDFSLDRIIPDCVRATVADEPILIRNPSSVRPYQHVLEPLHAYLRIIRMNFNEVDDLHTYNIGPPSTGCIATEQLVALFCRFWGDGSSYSVQGKPGPHEAEYLKLDCSRLTATLGWEPQWDVETAVEHTVTFYKDWYAGKNISALMGTQLLEYIGKELGTSPKFPEILI